MAPRSPQAPVAAPSAVRPGVSACEDDTPALPLPNSDHLEACIMRDSSLERRRRAPRQSFAPSGGRNARDASADDSSPNGAVPKATLSSMPRIASAGGGLIRSPQEAWETQTSLYTEDDIRRDGHDDAYADTAHDRRRPAPSVDEQRYDGRYDDQDVQDEEGYDDAAYDEDYAAQDSDGDYGQTPEMGDTSPRLRASSAARPLRTTKGRLMTGAALERLERQEQLARDRRAASYDRDDLYDPYDRDRDDDAPAGRSAARQASPRRAADDTPGGSGASGGYGRSGSSGAHSLADASLSGSSAKRRALVAVAPASLALAPSLSTASVPDLPAFRPPLAPRRPRIDTQRIIQSARSPWSLTRMALTLVAICLALVVGLSRMGEPSQPLMATGYQAQVGSQANQPLTTLVRPETQGKRPDLYDSYAQFNDWWDAACSAAVLSEILTAYGVPHMSIGRMIDELGPDISMYGGLINDQGFEHVVSKYGLRADYSSNLTLNQMRYITNTLGLPLIVNVRIAYGYYHFLSGGHFLVMTGGDQQGLRIVDSSEYYINYLPIDVFNSMFTGRTIAIVPAGYHYTLPSN